MKWDRLMGFFSKPKHFDEEEAIAVFKTNPSKHFTYRREPVVWPAADDGGHPIFLSNVRVLVGEYTLGFVERAHCTGKTAFIGHIAVAKALSGRGLRLGVLVARADAAELRARFGINRIVFTEDIPTMRLLAIHLSLLVSAPNRCPSIHASKERTGRISNGSNVTGAFDDTASALEKMENAVSSTWQRRWLIKENPVMYA